MTVLSPHSGKRANRIMKTAFLLAIFAAITFSCGTTFAQSNDMAITVSKPTAVNPPNSSSSMTITIENLGPDSAGAIFHVTSVSPRGPHSLSQPINYTFLSGPCQETPTDVPPGDTFGAWAVSTLNSGESVTCRWSLEMDAEPYADPVLVTWAVVPGGGLFTDPDRSNNTHSLLFQFSGTVDVPTLMTHASGFLFLVMLLMGFRQIVSRN